MCQGEQLCLPQVDNGFCVEHRTGQVRFVDSWCKAGSIFSNYSQN